MPAPRRTEATTKVTPSHGEPLRYALMSVAIGVGVLGLKMLAWAVTGSVALLSDALESIVNVAAAVTAVLMIRLADKPPDPRHPYGHGKAEYFSAVAEGILIIGAAIGIAAQAGPRIFSPTRPEAIDVGLLISAGASGLNALLAVALVRAGRRLRSPALVADGHHIYSDVVTSVGVLAGVGLAALTDLWILDPLLAVLVALNILRVGWRTVTSSVGGLMDEALPEEVQAAVRRAIETSMSGALEVHALRSRRSGRFAFVGLHLVVPGAMSVAEAHEICDRIEAAVRGVIGDASVTIHIEPETKAKCLDAGTGRVFDLAGPHAPPR